MPVYPASFPRGGALYADWVAGYDIAGEEGFAENPDNDAFDNLAEYGLGGAA
ncbi:hypothetical protein [Pontiella desulfatans]|uniref:hypothetical protein n=1 Tax=Pontiella desulfatans TaxID=2750659 RepID=UPI001443FEA2|nr:hypothetical protein [Pontiella desulfatans]